MLKNILYNTLTILLKLSFYLIGLTMIFSLATKLNHQTLASLLIPVFPIYYLSIFFHEFGHWLFGRIVRIHVPIIQMGNGKEIFYKFSILGLQIQLSKSIFGGFSFPKEPQGRFLKPRLMLFYSGGILVNSFLTFLSYQWIQQDGNAYINGILFWLFFWNLWLWLLNLVPQQIAFFEKQTPNDALAILTLPFWSKERLNEWLDGTIGTEVYLLLQNGNYAQAIPLLEIIVSKPNPNLNNCFQLAYAYFIQCEFEKSKEISEKFLNEENPYRFFHYNLLSMLFIFGVVEKEKALEFSNIAYQHDPKIFGLDRSFVLLFAERPQEGLELLNKNLNPESLPDTQAWIYLLKCFAYHQLNDTKNKEENLAKFLIPSYLNPSDQLLFEMIEKKINLQNPQTPS